MLLRRLSAGFRAAAAAAAASARFASTSTSSAAAAGGAPAASLAARDTFMVLEPPLPPEPVAAAADPTLLQPRVVIYDGVCHLFHRGVKLCTSAIISTHSGRILLGCPLTVPLLLHPDMIPLGVKWVIKADKYKKIKFCCLQSKAAEPYMKLCGVDREDVLRRFLFIEGLGACYEGSTAALKVASYLPFPYSALSSLLIVPGPLREAVYDYVAKRRYNWFGKEEECLVMRETEMLERFIDRDELMTRRDD